MRNLVPAAAAVLCQLPLRFTPFQIPAAPEAEPMVDLANWRSSKCSGRSRVVGEVESNQDASAPLVSIAVADMPAQRRPLKPQT